MLIVPAQAAHVAAMAIGTEGLRLTLPGRVYRLMLAQIAVSEAYSAFPDELATAPLVIGGLAPLDDGCVEAWFLVRPGGLARHLLPVVRFATALLAGRRPAICHVTVGNVAGERLAQILGFEPSDQLLDGAREWRLAWPMR